MTTFVSSQMSTSPTSPTSPVIISIEGNIGSGKSTLLEQLRTKYKNNKQIVFINEPVDEWDTIKDEDGQTILSKFYKNQSKYAFSFQMMAYISRLQAMKQAIEQNPESSIFITERSLYTDKHVFALMLYRNDKIEEVNFEIYNKWFEYFAKDYPINKMIYVKTAPEKCLERINKRSRNGESIIELEYLKTCDVHHEEMIYSKMKNTFSHVLDGNNDIFEKSDTLETWMNQINDVIFESDKQ
jgi:deoxyadenosine/deoxycytidine kinase